MKYTKLPLFIALISIPAVMMAQPSSFFAKPDAKNASSGVIVASPLRNPPDAPRPFSEIAIGGGISALGINLQIATNLNRHMNLRATGNVLQLTESNISTNGFMVNANLNLASAGASLDYYPFPNHGLRFSPGVLFHNSNGVSGAFTADGGTSFTLDNSTYYASTTNPVKGYGSVGLHGNNPAFTATAGWGNAFPHKGGHFSFPFEAGVALIGAPSVNVVLNSGQVCDAQGENCVNVATDSDVQANLQAQIAKYKNDLAPLKTYPIVSFGVTYNFHVRSRNRM
ncbi:MAG TPA: hypothetical protein VHX20_13755 [Terracidiphilus sp.]|nr:hypothetical protein [Terracidiphilus sp.]